jgi:hypothetical protein
MSSDFDLIIDDLLTLLNLSKVLMIRSRSPLPYNLGSPYLVHTLISQAYVTRPSPHFHSLLTLLNLC